MRVLITGANGQLGKSAKEEFMRRGHDVFAAKRETLDVTSLADVQKYVERCAPEVIVHCAAYTAVDRAEGEREQCFLVNATGTKNVALAAKSVGAKLIYPSTDYVFDGERVGEYDVDEEPHPLSVYGESKLKGEEEVKSILQKYFIVRTSWLFGEGKNFVETMLALSLQKRCVKVVCDQFGAPTYTDDLAPLLCDMAESEKYGTYHATSEGVCSWYFFAKEIFRLTKRKTLVEPIISEEYFLMSGCKSAPRPHNSCLSKRSLTAHGFSLLPDWRDALSRYIKKIIGEI